MEFELLVFLIIFCRIGNTRLSVENHKIWLQQILNKCDLTTQPQCSLDCSTILVCESGNETPVKTIECQYNTPFCDNGMCKSIPGSCSLHRALTKSNFLCTATGVFPDPSDCSKYHHCSGAGTPSTVFECPTRTVYNSKTKLCQRVIHKYGHASRKLCEKVDCDYKRNEFVKFPPNPAFYALCSTSSGNKKIFMYKCANEETYIFDSIRRDCIFTCPSAGYFTDSYDCNGYYICEGFHTFTVRRLKCPPEFFFNGTACVNSTKHCHSEFAHVSTTPSSPTQIHTTETSPDGGASSTDGLTSSTDGSISSTDGGISSTDGGTSSTDGGMSTTDANASTSNAGTNTEINETINETNAMPSSTASSLFTTEDATDSETNEASNENNAMPSSTASSLFTTEDTTDSEASQSPSENNAMPSSPASSLFTTEGTTDFETSQAPNENNAMPSSTASSLFTTEETTDSETNQASNENNAMPSSTASSLFTTEDATDSETNQASNENNAMPSSTASSLFTTEDDSDMNKPSHENNAMPSSTASSLFTVEDADDSDINEASNENNAMPSSSASSLFTTEDSDYFDIKEATDENDAMPFSTVSSIYTTDSTRDSDCPVASINETAAMSDVSDDAESQATTPTSELVSPPESQIDTVVAHYATILFIPCPIYLDDFDDEICSQVGGYLNFDDRDKN